MTAARGLIWPSVFWLGLFLVLVGLGTWQIYRLQQRIRELEDRDPLTGTASRAAFMSAGLRIDVFGGYWLKPLSNSQIESQWTQAMLDAFMQLGERYPDIAGEIYVLASNP